MFGRSLEFWMHRLLFLDALTYVSGNNIKLPLERFVSVDIDGVFMDYNGRKMNVKDVEALIKFQKRTEAFVPGFKFNMGFIGGMFETGTYIEQEANALLVKNAKQFWWYDNTYDRPNIRDTRAKHIADNIRKNQEFATKHKINVTRYGVTTNNFGVYPLYWPLYDAWNDVKITVSTGTHIRRAFTYRGVKVLPRSTYNMFNKDIFLVNAQEIFRSVEGGDTFNSILCNPINIFMTYFCNYGMDRVALYVIARSFDFIRKWTKLKLYSESSYSLAERYFTLFPNDVSPLWADPCKVVSYMPDPSLCEHRPDVLIVGPATTGSNTLKSLLMEIGNIGWNKDSLNYLSTDDKYSTGTDDYFKQFPIKSSTVENIYEYSPDYFSNQKAPERAGNILPKVKVIIVIARPEIVAKECFDKEDVGDKMTFYDMVKSHPEHPCVLRAMHADHMRRWSTYYTEQQMLVIDTDRLYADTAKTMEQIQKFIGVPKRIDYSTILKFNSSTGVFCRGNICLGNDELPYRSFTNFERDVSVKIYKKQITFLRGLLSAMNQAVPVWADKP